MRVHGLCSRERPEDCAPLVGGKGFTTSKGWLHWRRVALASGRIAFGFAFQSPSREGCLPRGGISIQISIQVAQCEGKRRGLRIVQRAGLNCVCVQGLRGRGACRRCCAVVCGRALVGCARAAWRGGQGGQPAVPCSQQMQSAQAARRATCSRGVRVGFFTSACAQEGRGSGGAGARAGGGRVAACVAGARHDKRRGRLMARW